MQFKTTKAIELAGSAKELAALLGVTQSAVSQWGEDLPKARIWQLMTLRPNWFKLAANTNTTTAEGQGSVNA